MGEPEILLPGGDVTEGVVRVGATVRRPVGEHSAAVHRVLRYLEDVGFDGAPRFLGIDERGREMLTYVDGEVAGRPGPAWLADEGRAVSVARLLRRLDDAVIPLGVSPDLGFESSGAKAERGAPRFLGHRDVTPENTVFRDGEAYAFIDFDFVRPSTRVDEVCNLLLWWGPWMPVEDRDPVMRDIDAAARGRLLADAYGLAQDDRGQVVDASIDIAHRSWFAMRDRALTRGGGWARMWDDGIGDRIRRREQWLRDNRDELHSALVDARGDLSGVVEAGRGLGAVRTADPGALRVLNELAGFPVVAGTLNLRLPEAVKRDAQWHYVASTEIGPNWAAQTGQAGYFIARVTIAGGFNGLAFQADEPAGPGYPPDLIELFSEVRLRDALGLRDGDHLVVKVRDQ